MWKAVQRSYGGAAGQPSVGRLRFGDEALFVDQRANSVDLGVRALDLCQTNLEELDSRHCPGAEESRELGRIRKANLVVRRVTGHIDSARILCSPAGRERQKHVARHAAESRVSGVHEQHASDDHGAGAID